MIILNELVHSLRYYVKDTLIPYKYRQEELEVYLKAYAEKVGLETLYPTWVDVPGKFRGLIILGGYVHWLLVRGAEAVASSGTTVEELSIKAESGSDFADLIKQAREQLKVDEKDLGADLPIISSTEVTTATRWDRYLRSYVPYEASNAPPKPVLVAEPPGVSSVQLLWSRYKDQDFSFYLLERSPDGVTWTEILREPDAHKHSFLVEDLGAGDHSFRVSTTLENQLATASDLVEVTIP